MHLVALAFPAIPAVKPVSIQLRRAAHPAEPQQDIISMEAHALLRVHQLDISTKQTLFLAACVGCARPVVILAAPAVCALFVAIQTTCRHQHASAHVHRDRLVLALVLLGDTASLVLILSIV